MSNTTAESATLTITGYDTDTVCECCGKKLVHGIRLADGRTVGAQCFNKVLTKPLTYSGKTYRLGAEGIIKYAKVAEYYTPAEGGRRFGIYPNMLTFQSAE
jgi:hypothetical protein